MRANNTLAPRKERQTFSAAVTGDSLQNLIRKSVATPQAAARFTGTLISAVAASTQLQNCVPATVVAAALRGEGMGLTLGREYHLIPFGEKCAFVIGYKGLISLCLAGNDVADIDCVEVREGEIAGRDKRTKRINFDFSVYKTDEEAAKHDVIGYYAYVEMASGYFRYEYMTVAEILDHASRYSKAFDLAKWKKLQKGEYSPQEAERLKEGSPWYSSFDTMAKKTVMRRLLNSGYVRLANSTALKEALEYDAAVESDIIPDLEMPDPVFVTAEGEVVEQDAETVSAEQEKPKRGRKPKKVDEDADDAVTDFFGEEVQE